MKFLKAVKQFGTRISNDIIAPKDYVGDFISYDEAVTSGVLGGLINIDMGTKWYDDKMIYAPAFSILKEFSRTNALSSVVRGWERTTPKDILYCDTWNSSNSAGAHVHVELKNVHDNWAKDIVAKDNVIERQIVVFDFVPTDAGYTNEGFVSSKATGDMVTVEISPCDPTKKLGIAETDEIPDGTMMNMLGTFFPQKSGSVEPISFYPTKIENTYQYFKTPYEFDEIAAKERLFVQGNIRTMLDSDAQKMHLSGIEKSFLFQGESYRHDTLSARTDDAARESVGKMRGLFYAIANGGSPANDTYDTWTHEVFDQFQFNLFDPELEDPNNRRLVLCNKATVKYFTDLKKDKPGIEIAPDDTYGIAGIRKVTTDYGTLDLLVLPKINAMYPSMTEPFMAALTPTMIEIKDLVKTYLANGIQANDSTAYKAEYRTALTWLGYNLHTGLFGMLRKG
jgi:hypothetical protein